MSGIGGYMPRKDRRYVPSAVPDPSRCSVCHGRYLQGPFVDSLHICKEPPMWQAMPILRFEPFEVTGEAA